MVKYLFLFILAFSAVIAQAQEDISLAQYKGVYKLREGSPAPSIEISIQNGALHAASTVGSAALSKIARDTFSIPEHSGMVYFYRSTVGVVNAIKVEVGNMAMEGNKEPNAMAFKRKKYVYAVTSR